jgi:hypothetical protein
MKRLRVEYGNIILFDGEVAEVSWTDSEDGVSVTGKTKKNSGPNLFDLLAGAAKNKSDEDVEQRKAEYEAEKAEKAAARRPAKKAAIEEAVIAE